MVYSIGGCLKTVKTKEKPLPLIMNKNSSSPGSRQTQTAFPPSLSSVGAAMTSKPASEVTTMIEGSFDIDSLIVYMVYKDICSSSDWIQEQNNKLAVLPKIRRLTEGGKLVLDQIDDKALGSHLTIAGRLIEDGFLMEVDDYINNNPLLSRLIVYHMFGCPFGLKAWCAAVARELQRYPSFTPFVESPESNE